MDIRDLLLKDVMIMDMHATTKDEAIDELVHKYAEQGIINDEALYKQDIIKREAESTTGIGDGIAMPHAKDKAVNRATVMDAVESFRYGLACGSATAFSEDIATRAKIDEILPLINIEKLAH
ncbi:hypothetical protein WP50_06210 [Lactiplantibacillus plantarum]|nr:hypothetical protein WP50_06210 [Lactiplantibacillus plantarum]